MYPSERTLTEELNEFIKNEKPLQENIIHEYIKKFDTTKMDEGDDYYFKRNDITHRKIYKYNEQGQKEIDLDATNNKLASGWHKLLVDQKVGYLAGSEITIGYKDDEDIEDLLEILGDDFDDTIPELIKQASNRGKGWLHPYIDREGYFDYMVIPAQEVIPLYDNTKRKNLVGVIRFYELDHDDIIKVEVWTEKDVTYYEIIDGKISLDMSEEENPSGHFKYGNDWYPWGKVPFIEFKNNEESISDLTFYKDFIDAYDYLMSDTTNTLEDIQDIFYILKGYEETNLAEFSTNMKRYKAVKTSADGGIETAQAEVPIDSVNSHLDRLVEDLYQFGMGVNTNTDKFGNSPSGIALKFLFSLLDMKADVLERKFTKALKQFMWFVTEYADIANVGDYDPHKVTFTFNKSMLMNEREQVEMAQMSKGIISDESVVENHPWTSNVQEEIERVKEQREQLTDLNQQVEPPTGEGNE